MLSSMDFHVSVFFADFQDLPRTSQDFPGISTGFGTKFLQDFHLGAVNLRLIHELRIWIPEGSTPADSYLMHKGWNS